LRSLLKPAARLLNIHSGYALLLALCASLVIQTPLVYAAEQSPVSSPVSSIVTPTAQGSIDDFFKSADQGFLPVAEAFGSQLRSQQTDQQPNKIVIAWQVTDGYYLYRDRFKFSIESSKQASIESVELPQGELKNDDYFGETEVYHHSIESTLLISNKTNSAYIIKAVFQGCADAGLCYPPTTRRFSIQPVGASAASSVTDQSIATPNAAESSTTVETTSSENQLLELLNQATLAKIMLLFFIAGIGLTFTPCVLPMIPILSSVVIGQNQTPSRSRAFLLSGSYVLGMALAFTLAGALMGYFGAQLNLQARLQSPLLLSIFALFFVGLSLSMFGYYELRLPSSLQNKVDALSRKQKGGTLFGASAMGVLSALVVSPCVSAPLAAALVYISTTGDATLGALALMMLSLGMGAPLVVIATLGSHLLPKSGGWMDDVKTFFGILLLGVAIWLLERILPGQITLILWAILLAGTASFLQLTDATGSRFAMVLRKTLALLMTIYCATLIVGASLGGQNPLNPLAPLLSGGGQTSTANHSELTFYPADNPAQLAQLIEQAKAQGKPLMIDFYADWCGPCQSLLPTVEKLSQEYEGKVEIQKVNVDQNRELAAKFGIRSIPALFFMKNQEIVDRVNGVLPESVLREKLDALLN